MKNDPSAIIDVILRIAPYCAILLIMLIASWYALRLLRVHLSKTEFRPADYLESFQKLHEAGELSGEEFRLVRKLISLHFTQSPDEPKSSRELKPDYSLLNHNTPLQPVDRPSGKIPKK